MTAPSPLADLIARVEAAIGADRDLDLAIWGALVAKPPAPHPERSLAYVQPAPVTASLDAALALTEAVGGAGLWTIGVEHTPLSDHPSCNKACAFITGRDFTSERVAHRTPALALILALLRAKAAGQ